MNQEIFDLKPLTKEEVFYRFCQGVVSSKNVRDRIAKIRWRIVKLIKMAKIGRWRADRAQVTLP